jgi:glycosyltransferase involved in cell wall biosynthesis
VFTTPSAACRRKHHEFGFPREMEVVPNLLSRPADESRTPMRPHQRPYFLFVGRLKRFKGLDDVIPALNRYPDADLLIAGDGDHGPELRRLAAGNPRVVFLGAVAPERLGGYYKHAIASLMPTISFETFGMAVIESLMYGTPVLARRRGAPVEILERCSGGELFDNADELLAGMRRIQADPAYRERLGAAAARGYRAYWSEQAVVPCYLDVVQRAAQRTGRPALAGALAAELAASPAPAIV